MGYGTLRAAGIPHGAALAGASVATVAVGAGKEIYDAGHHGDPSVKDFAWDLAGAGAMTVLLVHTRRRRCRCRGNTSFSTIHRPLYSEGPSLGQRAAPDSHL